MPAPPTTSIRWVLALRLIEQIRDAPELVDVRVEPGWPGERFVKPEMVWIDDIDGDVTIPLIKAARKIRDDEFTVPLEIRVTNRKDLDATMSRLFEIIAAIEDALADSITLGDGASALPGLIACAITSIRTTAAGLPEGHVGFGEVIVTAHTRLE